MESTRKYPLRTNAKSKRGRPKKIPRIRPNSGRKRKVGTTVGRTKRFLLAKQIIALADNDEEFLEYTLDLCRKMNKMSNTSKKDDGEYSVDYEIVKDEAHKMHTNESALALYIESNLNKNSYTLIATDCRSRGSPLLPSYPLIKKSMDECLPTDIKYSEDEVKVNLQSMLNKTAERLCEAVSKKWSCKELQKITLFVTSGFDSSAGHLNPHQNYSDTDTIVNDDAQQTLLVTSFIVQKLSGQTCSWINPMPQSTRFCRPLRISFEKEDSESITKEYQRLSKEIGLLQRHRFKMSNGKRVIATFNVSQTLYDGKVVNCIVRNSATTRCPICGISSHKFGDLNENFEARKESLRYGLGLLHCLIKSFEYLLHLAYRTTIKEWDRRKHLIEDANKQTEKVRQQINSAFGVRVDRVLQGHGTTNTGNLARRCFENPLKFSEALELDYELVNNISLILRLLQSKYDLDLDKFQELCDTTYEINFSRYPWSRMCPTLHKMLKHSTDIIKQFPLPIAYYAEDASESSHKIYRENMVSHARQVSRQDRISDTFTRAVYTTDPVISMIYIDNRLKSQPRHQVTQEMTFYLKNR